MKVIEAYFNKHLSNQYLYVAELENKVASTLFLEARRDFFNNKSLLHISILAVSKCYEELGIGSKPLKYTEEFSRELNITKISLNVSHRIIMQEKSKSFTDLTLSFLSLLQTKNQVSKLDKNNKLIPLIEHGCHREFL